MTDRIEGLLRDVGLPADRQTAGRIERYVSLLEKWNARMNLVASNDWGLIAPLVQEALWAAGTYPKGAVTHLDIGSGAGFPAVPMRILIPRMQLDMVDSRYKRVRFLETVAVELGLSGMRAFHGRLEQFLEGRKGCWDCISWKGLKLRTRDLESLRGRAHAQTQFWMFHGRELPVEDPGWVLEAFRRIRLEDFPRKPGWRLSVFLPG